MYLLCSLGAGLSCSYTHKPGPINQTAKDGDDPLIGETTDDILMTDPTGGGWPHPPPCVPHLPPGRGCGSSAGQVGQEGCGRGCAQLCLNTWGWTGLVIGDFILQMTVEDGGEWE